MDLRLLFLGCCLGMAFVWIDGPTPAGQQFAADVAEAIRRKITRSRAALLMGIPLDSLNAQLDGTAHLSLRGVARLPASVYQELIHIRAHKERYTA
jgi:hypothetical protein